MNYSSDFSLLSPQMALNAVESAFGLKLTGTLMPYVSYVNRVYGITDQDRNEYVVKFYRPNRWNRQAIEEEHLLLLDCYKSEVPVVTPISNSEGITLHTLRVDNEDNMSIFPTYVPKFVSIPIKDKSNSFSILYFFSTKFINSVVSK